LPLSLKLKLPLIINFLWTDNNWNKARYRLSSDKITFVNRGKILKKYKFKYVITVSAMWNILARETMAPAAIKTIIIKGDELAKIIFLMTYIDLILSI
jgi:hypothetical protein